MLILWVKNWLTHHLLCWKQPNWIFSTKGAGGSQRTSSSVRGTAPLGCSTAAPLHTTAALKWVQLHLLPLGSSWSIIVPQLVWSRKQATKLSLFLQRWDFSKTRVNFNDGINKVTSTHSNAMDEKGHLLSLLPVSWVSFQPYYLFSTNPLCDWSHTSFSIITLYFISVLRKEPPVHTESSNAWNSFPTPIQLFLRLSQRWEPLQTIPEAFILVTQIFLKAHQCWWASWLHFQQ